MILLAAGIALVGVARPVSGVATPVPYTRNLQAIGMEDGTVLSAQLSASSTHPHCSPNNGRVNVIRDGGAWCAATATVGDYFQVDLGTDMRIAAVGTQGRHGDSPDFPANSESHRIKQWVTYYEIRYRVGTTWHWMTEGGRTKTFIGNKSQLQLKVNRLLDPLPLMNMIRIYVKGFEGWPSMRVELYTGGVLISAPPAVTLSPRDKSVYIRGVTVLDDGCGDVRVTLTMPNAVAPNTVNPTMVIASTTGVNVVDGDGDNSVIIEGPVVDVQRALDRILVTASPVTPSSTTMTIKIDRINGATGHGSQLVHYTSWNFERAVWDQARPQIKESWATGTPGGPVPAEYWSTRWTARFVAPHTGSYGFITNVDDGSRLWVNGVNLLNDWSLTAARDRYTAKISLTAGQTYSIVNEFYEYTGYASSRVDWYISGVMARQTIPNSHLWKCPLASDTITISIDEGTAAPKVVTFPSPPVADESAAPTTFDVRLDGDPGGIVEVTLTTDSHDQINFPPFSVRFDQTNWNVLRPVPLSAVDDLIQEDTPKLVDIWVGFGVGTGNEGPGTVQGTEAEGEVTGTGATIEHVYAYVTDTTVALGSTRVNIEIVGGDSSTYANALFNVGDEIYIWQVQHETNHGVWEFNYVQAFCGNGCMDLTLSTKNAYYSGNAHTGPISQTVPPAGQTRSVLITKVVHYTTLTIRTGASMEPPAWNGKTGGILAYRCSVEMKMEGSGEINLHAKGFRGGSCGTCNSHITASGWQGEGYLGFGAPLMKANGNGGGGGYGPSNRLGEPGAGGGNRYFGELGKGWETQAEGGFSAGDPDLSRIYFGGGAGAGGDDDLSTPLPQYRHGGGVLIAFAQKMTYASSTVIRATGDEAITGMWRGGSKCSCAAQSGGGAGGTVWVTADVVPATLPIDVTGGPGIFDFIAWKVLDYGGGGGDGWIKLDSLDVQPFTAIDNRDPIKVEVIDDDIASIVLSPVLPGLSNTLTVAEEGTQTKRTYKVKLGTQPTAAVTVSLASLAGEVILSQSSLVYSASTWNTFQTVTVTGKPNDGAELNPQADTIRHTPTSSDKFYRSPELGHVDVPLTVTAQPRVTHVDPARAGTDEQPVVMVYGHNFDPTASPAAQRSASIGGTTCASPNWIDDTRMSCTAPVGAGTAKSVEVTIHGWASDPNTRFSYDPPEITALDLAEGDTEGGYVVTVHGHNFGAASVASRSSTLGGTACTTLARVSHEILRCTAPDGVGVNRPVRVTVDGQIDISDPRFSYRPPTITEIDPPNGPAVGGYGVTVRGTNFGSHAHSISIGGTACMSAPTWQASPHTQVVCPAPNGVGAARVIALAVGGQGYASPAVAEFSYDPPSVTSLDPNYVRAEGGVEVTVHGINFGESSWGIVDPGEPVLTIGPGPISGSMSCTAEAWVSDAIMLCTVPEGTPYKPVETLPLVSVTVSNQTGAVEPLTYFINWHLHTPVRDISIPGRPIDVDAYGLNVTHEYRCKFTLGATVLRSDPAVPTSTREIRCLTPDWPYFRETFEIELVDAATDVAHAYTGAAAPFPTYEFAEGWISLDPPSGVAGIPTLITFQGGGLNASWVYTCEFEVGSYKFLGVGHPATDSRTLTCTVPIESSFAHGGRTSTVRVFRDGFGPEVEWFGVFPQNQFEFLIVLPLAPDPPTHPAPDVEPFQVSAHWDPATIARSGGSPVTRYHLYHEGTLIYSGPDLSTLSANLFPDTDQSYTVSYENVAGEGPQSAPSLVRTLPSGPIFHAIDPPEGIQAGGQNVTITGIQFGRVRADLLSLTIGDRACEPIYEWSPTHVLCETPPSITPGSADVEMVTTYGSSTSLPDTLAVVLDDNRLGFLYISPPEISAVHPSWAPVFADIPVTVTGASMGRTADDVVAASLARIPCRSYTYTSDSEITCRTGPVPDGRPVTLEAGEETASGGPSVRSVPFRYTIPTIESAYPVRVSATGETLVTLTGQHVGLELPDVKRVLFGTHEADLLTLTWAVSGEANVLTVNAPEANVIGFVPVYVETTTGGMSPAGPLVEYYRPGFTVLPPVVTATDPGGSLLEGNVLINVYGTDLGQSASDLQSVSLVGITCLEIQWVSPGQVSCLAGSTDIPLSGDPIVATRTGGAGYATTAYTYFPETPIIDDVCPKVFSAPGGTVVTVHGQHLGLVDTGQEVFINGVACDGSTYVSPSEATCIVPAETTVLGSASGAAMSFTITVHGQSSAPFAHERLGYGTICEPSCGCGGVCVDPGPGAEPFCNCDAWWTSPPECDIPSVTTDPPVVNATEDVADTPGRIPVYLHQRPQAEVYVRVAINDTTEGTLRADTLTFTPSNWDTSQSILIDPIYDDLRDGYPPVLVSVTVESVDPKFSGVPVPPIPTVVGESSPIIDHIDPEVHPLNGTTVTIEGRNFDPVLDVMIDTTVLSDNATLLIKREGYTHLVAPPVDPAVVVSSPSAGDGDGDGDGVGEDAGADARARARARGEAIAVGKSGRAASSGAGRIAALASPDDVVAVRTVSPEHDAGYVDVWILNGGGTRGVREKGIFYTADCPTPGTYGRGVDCKPCPEGAVCPGGYRLWPKDGYWAPSEDAGYVQQCKPLEACVGGRDGGCGEGYEGDFCSNCKFGWYKDPAEECEACPSYFVLGLFLLSDIIIWLLLAIAGITVRSHENVSHIVMFILSVQQISSVGRMLGPRSPRVLRTIYEVLKLFEGDYNYVKPECLGMPPGYDLEFIIQLIYSLAIGIPIVGIVPLARWVSDRYHQRHGPEVVAERHRFYSMRMVRMFTIWLLVIYLPLTGNAYRAVSCITIGDTPVLLTDPSTECFTRGHKTTIFLSSMIIIFLTIGYPAVYTYKLLRNKDLMFDDLKFAEKLNFLYEPYKDKFWWLFIYFELVILNGLALSDATTSDPKKQFFAVMGLFGIQLLAMVLLRPYHRKWEGYLMLAFNLTNIAAVVYNYMSQTDFATDEQLKLCEWILVALVMACLCASASVVIYFLWIVYSPRNSLYGHDYFISKAIARSMRGFASDSTRALADDIELDDDGNPLFVDDVEYYDGGGDGGDDDEYYADDDGDGHAHGGGGGSGVAIGAMLGAGAAAAVVGGAKKRQKKVKRKKTALTPGQAPPQRKVRRTSIDSDGNEVNVSEYEDVPLDEIDFSSEYVYTTDDGAGDGDEGPSAAAAAAMTAGGGPAARQGKFSMVDSDMLARERPTREVLTASVPAFAMPALAVPGPSRYGTDFIDSSSDGEDPANVDNVNMLIDADVPREVDWGFGVLWDDPALLHQMYGAGVTKFEEITDAVVDRSRKPADDIKELLEREIDVTSVTGDPDPRKVFEINATYLNRRIQQCLFRMCLGLKFVRFVPKYRGLEPESLPSNVPLDVPQDPIIKRLILPWGQQNFAGVGTLSEMVDGIVMDIAVRTRKRIVAGLGDEGFAVLSDINIRNIDFPHKRNIIIELMC